MSLLRWRRVLMDVAAATGQTPLEVATGMNWHEALLWWHEASGTGARSGG